MTRVWLRWITALCLAFWPLLVTAQEGETTAPAEETAAPEEASADPQPEEVEAQIAGSLTQDEAWLRL